MAKKRFLLVHRSQPGGDRKAPTQEAMDAMYARFAAWNAKYADCIIDMGGKLAPDGRVVTADRVTDGPFAETKELIGGYMLVEADSIDEAVDIARESPGTMAPGSSVEVREISVS